MGLVNRVVPADKLMEEALAFAGELARGPTKAIGQAKRAVYGSLSLDLEQSLALEGQLQTQALSSSDYQEGVRAFLEKRPPQFRGR